MVNFKFWLNASLINKFYLYFISSSCSISRLQSMLVKRTRTWTIPLESQLHPNSLADFQPATTTKIYST